MTLEDSHTVREFKGGIGCRVKDEKGQYIINYAVFASEDHSATEKPQYIQLVDRGYRWAPERTPPQWFQGLMPLGKGKKGKNG